MPGFDKTPFAMPFGQNQFLRSTRAVKTISRTVAASTVPAVTIDNWAGQKVLQKGVVLATITSGPEAGKVGPFQGVGTEEIQTITPSGTWSGGTYTLTSNGKTTAAIAYNAIASVANAALVAAGITDITLSGGPLSSGAFTVTYTDFPVGVDEAAIAISVVSVTGSTPTAAVTTGTPGVAGATDGRGVTANIVGINNTFLPWQLVNRDVEVAVVYDADVVQGFCIEMNAAGVWVALTDTTAGFMFGKKALDIHFAA